jgi:hypothetical protein
LIFGGDCVKFSFRLFISLFLVLVSGSLFAASAQSDFFVGEVTASIRDSAVKGMSGDGRLILFQSTGNHASEFSNRNNADANSELFLYDYAQRRVFQITNTKSVLKDTTKDSTFDNIKVDIVNVEASLSTDGKWIVFASNATTSTPTAPDSTNPGNFDGNVFTNTTTSHNPLEDDGNTEIWLYRIPDVVSVDLTSGVDVPLVDLSAGTFTRVTNTLPSRLPLPGDATNSPFVPWDSRETSISDDGNVIAYTSNRDIVTNGNAFPNDDNTEIYTYVRTGALSGQITKTPRFISVPQTGGSPQSIPVFNQNPSISGDGLHIAFYGNGINPIQGMAGGDNADANGEIFYTDLDAAGNATGSRKQITKTTRTTLDGVVNTFSPGKRISRTGRFVTFESIANLVDGGTNLTANGTFLYDSTLATNATRQIGPRGNEDAGAPEGDILRAPTFTDYDGAGIPQSLMLVTRLNIKADGTIPATASDGLNPDDTRPIQFYTYQLGVPAASAKFTRITKFPAADFIAASQPLPSNTHKRVAFNIGLEIGTGNPGNNQAFYLYVPDVATSTPATYSYLSGATSRIISNDAVPTPSPTATVTPTPTPTATVTPTPTPTPVTPPAVQGISRGMLAELNVVSGMTRSFTPTSATGNTVTRAPALPMELNGVTVAIDGATCGLKRINRKTVLFVAPQGILAGSHDMTIYNNGLLLRGKVTVVDAQPDIFAKNMPEPGLMGGRVRALNVTNRVQTGEPFVVRTVKIKGGVFVDSVIRVYMTGIHGLGAGAFTVRLKDKTLVTGQVISGATLSEEPGVYYIDFKLGTTLQGLGNAPLVITVVTPSGATFTTRVDDTTSFLTIL